LSVYQIVTLFIVKEGQFDVRELNSMFFFFVIYSLISFFSFIELNSPPIEHLIVDFYNKESVC